MEKFRTDVLCIIEGPFEGTLLSPRDHICYQVTEKLRHLDILGGPFERPFKHLGTSYLKSDVKEAERRQSLGTVMMKSSRKKIAFQSKNKAFHEKAFLGCLQNE